MGPPAYPSLKPDEILALLSDEDDDDLDPLSVSEDDGSEAEDAPPDVVEVLDERGELTILLPEDINLFALRMAPPDTSEPPPDDQIVLTPPPPDEEEGMNPPLQGDGDGEEDETLPSPNRQPSESFPFVASPGSQVGPYQ
jgi:hypothetical protein